MSQIAVQPVEYQFSKKQIMWGLMAIFVVYGTMAFSVHTMIIARPKIAADLDGLALYAWSVSIPSLIMALSTVIFGKLSDMHGRRNILMVSLTAAFIGTVMGALSPNFVFMIFAGAIAAVGAGAMIPLVFAVVGDLFPPAVRSKWIGLLNIPLGVFTIIGPALGGFIVDTLSWRYLYWMAIPMLIVCLIMVPVGVPSLVNRDHTRKIDVKGCIWMMLAASTSIIGFSIAGTTYPWLSIQVIGLLGFSLLCWIIFLRVESVAPEPVLDPILLRNRMFRTVALATFFSSFGTMGMMMYFPMFLQGVQGISTFHSGFITTPYGVLTAFMGVPVGYIIARSGRFKWMYVGGYGILSVGIFGLVLLHADAPVFWSVAIAVLAGFGYGVIPTINTVVVQNAIPKRLMGVAMGAVFFFISIGSAIAPAILGSTMNVAYTRAITQSMPEGLRAVADERT
ncbi:MAG TPA: MFS transporter, partial [Acidobacteriota bacterium]|nr:MFS transporter [Acidobacteriota bacterium]